MILKNATIKYKGYDPEDLKPNSHKRICMACDECGRVRYGTKQAYRDLCINCSRSGERNPMYGKNRSGKLNPMFGKKHSDETKKKISKSHKGKHLSDEHKEAISEGSLHLSGKNHPCFGIKHTENQKILQSKRMLGENNPMYGKKHSKETKKLQSKNRKGKNCEKNNHNYKPKINLTCKQCSKDYEVILSLKDKSNFCNKKCMNKWMSKNNIGSNNPHWKGGFDQSRPYLVPKNQCIKLNSFFKGSNAHHLMSGVVVYIPSNLHNHLYHSLKDNINMNIINKLSLQYLVGGDI